VPSAHPTGSARRSREPAECAYVGTGNYIRFAGRGGHLSIHPQGNLSTLSKIFACNAWRNVAVTAADYAGSGKMLNTSTRRAASSRHPASARFSTDEDVLQRRRHMPTTRTAPTQVSSPLTHPTPVIVAPTRRSRRRVPPLRSGATALLRRTGRLRHHDLPATHDPGHRHRGRLTGAADGRLARASRGHGAATLVTPGRPDVAARATDRPRSRGARDLGPASS